MHSPILLFLRIYLQIDSCLLSLQLLMLVCRSACVTLISISFSIMLCSRCRNFLFHLWTCDCNFFFVGFEESSPCTTTTYSESCVDLYILPCSAHRKESSFITCSTTRNGDCIRFASSSQSWSSTSCTSYLSNHNTLARSWKNDMFELVNWTDHNAAQAVWCPTRKGLWCMLLLYCFSIPFRDACASFEMKIPFYLLPCLFPAFCVYSLFIFLESLSFAFIGSTDSTCWIQ